MTFSGFCSNFAGLMVCRVLLGVFEAGFFPGAVWIISSWYPPKMTQFRMSMLYCAAAMSGAFSGLFAAAIAKMSGVAGYNGWRWIFIIEGILTVVLGASAYFILPDSPAHSSRWLSQSEIGYLQHLYKTYRRGTVNTENAEGERAKPKGHDWKTLRSVLLDWQIYLQALIFTSSSVPTYAMKFTLPQIMVNMGFSRTNAQLLSATPYVCGAISALIVARIADKFFWRLPFIIGPQTSLVVAYAVLFSFSAKISDNVALCYTFVHWAMISVYPIIPGGNTVSHVPGVALHCMSLTRTTVGGQQRRWSNQESHGCGYDDRVGQLWWYHRQPDLRCRREASLSDWLGYELGLHLSWCMLRVYSGTCLQVPEQEAREADARGGRREVYRRGA
jgi:MFS family permease